jgi:hypothetical protein
LPQRRDRAVAGHDLNQHQPHHHQRRERPVPPAVPQAMGRLIQRIGDGKIRQRLALEAGQNLSNLNHPWPPVG